MKRNVLKTVALLSWAAAWVSINSQAQDKVFFPGLAKAEVYRDIGGNSVSTLTGNAKYPNNPDEVQYLKYFEFPAGADDGTAPPGNVIDNYGARISAWIAPSQTANYFFIIAADDNAQLWLSTDENPANRKQIAQEPQWNPVRAFASESRRPGCPTACENKSAPVRLEANKRYYVELLFKEGLGGDNGAMIVQKEGDAAPNDGDTPLNGNLMGLLAAPTPEFVKHPSDAKQEPGKTATFSALVKDYANFQWLKNGSPIAGAIRSTYTTPSLTAAENGAKFKVRATVGANSVESKEATLTVVAAAQEFSRGFLQAEVFTGIGGTALDGLRSDAKYTDNKPDRVEYVPLFEYPAGSSSTAPPSDVFNNYGVRISGWLVPLETASYVFYLASDDNGELYLSTDDKPANEVLIASEPQWNPVRAFASTDRRPGCPDACENKSAPIRLEAGRRYWVRAEMKEGGGGDNLAVTWVKEGQPAPANGTVPILGVVLGTLANPNLAPDITITQQPQNATVLENTSATFAVAATSSTTLGYQWQKAPAGSSTFADIPGAAAPTYVTPRLPASDNGAKFRAVIAVPGKSINSGEATVTVESDKQPPTLVSARRTFATATNVKVTFSEPVSAATANVAANYAINNGVTVSSAALSTDGPFVLLTTSAIQRGTSYTLTVKSVQDPFGNTIASNSQIEIGFERGVLLVTSNPGLNAGDTALKNHLEANGYAVTVMRASDTNPPDAEGKDLVITSSTTGSGDLTDRLKETPVPVLNWEQALQDDFAMTGNTADTDRATIGGQTSLNIIKSDHPLAAGLPIGNVRVTTSPQTFSWGLPVASATRIATVAGNPNQVVIYGYEKGAIMVDGFVAPARRIQFFFEDAAASAVTDEGWRLFDAAVNWAQNITVTLPPTPAKFDPVVRQGNNVVISWIGTGKLQQADAVTGPWTDAANQTSPQTISVAGAVKFYRIRQ